MDIQNKIRVLLGKIDGMKVPIEQIGLEDDLFLLGLNSINLVELVVVIEESFGFEFTDVDLTPRNLKSIACIAEFIKSRLNMHNN